MFAMPDQATAVTCDFSRDKLFGISQPKSVWFNEPAEEMCLRSDHYDEEMTLLHFESVGPDHEEEVVEDTFDRFTKG